MAVFLRTKIEESFPPQFRLATREEVTNNKQAMLAEMPAWEICNLADGSVDGASYGGVIRKDIRTDVTEKLGILDVFVDPDTTYFQLFDVNETLPFNYRMATKQEVIANREALFQAMPEWEIANLANGSVDGAKYGGEVRSSIRDDVSHQLAVLCGPLKFQLFNLDDDLPSDCRLATVGEVEAFKSEVLEAMPGWEIANLADGSVDGASYGGKTKKEIRDDVTHQLAVVM